MAGLTTFRCAYLKRSSMRINHVFVINAWSCRSEGTRGDCHACRGGALAGKKLTTPRSMHGDSCIVQSRGLKLSFESEKYQ
jgi:hypothetical protein